jgi:antitoxin VapB
MVEFLAERHLVKSLNIKDPQTHELATQLARLTGESLTCAVREALKERLERVERRTRKATAEEILAMAREIGKSFKEPYEDHSTLLYDEYGLPK